MARPGTLTNRSSRCDDSKQVNGKPRKQENSLTEASPDPALAGDQLLGCSRRRAFLICPGVPGSKGPFLTCRVLGDRGSFVCRCLFRMSLLPPARSHFLEGPHHSWGRTDPTTWMQIPAAGWAISGVMVLRVNLVTDKVRWQCLSCRGARPPGKCPENGSCCFIICLSGMSGGALNPCYSQAFLIYSIHSPTIISFIYI